jgi:hypothetical protein
MVCPANSSYRFDVKIYFVHGFYKFHTRVGFCITPWNSWQFNHCILLVLTLLMCDNGWLREEKMGLINSIFVYKLFYILVPFPLIYQKKYQFLRFNNLSSRKADHLKFIQNVFMLFAIPWVIPLFTLAGSWGFCVLWTIWIIE